MHAITLMKTYQKNQQMLSSNLKLYRCICFLYCFILWISGMDCQDQFVKIKNLTNQFLLKLPWQWLWRKRDSVFPLPFSRLNFSPVLFSASLLQTSHSTGNFRLLKSVCPSRTNRWRYWQNSGMDFLNIHWYLSSFQCHSGISSIVRQTKWLKAVTTLVIKSVYVSHFYSSLHSSKNSSIILWKSKMFSVKIMTKSENLKWNPWKSSNILLSNTSNISINLMEGCCKSKSCSFYQLKNT